MHPKVSKQEIFIVGEQRFDNEADANRRALEIDLAGELADYFQCRRLDPNERSAALKRNAIVDFICWREFEKSSEKNTVTDISPDDALPFDDQAAD